MHTPGTYLGVVIQLAPIRVVASYVYMPSPRMASWSARIVTAMNTSTSRSWLSNLAQHATAVVFEAGNVKGDYHDNMN